MTNFEREMTMNHEISLKVLTCFVRQRASELFIYGSQNSGRPLHYCLYDYVAYCD
jgi:hypothetical protein